MKTLLYNKEIKEIPMLIGKTIIITGTTSGIGFITVKTLLDKGARILLLNRKSVRSKNSFKYFLSYFPKADLHNIECDLQNFQSVNQAIEQITYICKEGIDVLCNNAGVMALKDLATIDGFDVQMQVNHLSHFLLTRRLMPLIELAAKNKGESRVINHSSIARFGCEKLDPIYLEKRGGELGGNQNGRWIRYSQTKLANAVFTACLYERMKNKNINVKSLVAHSGLVKTEIQNTTSKDGAKGLWLSDQMLKNGQSLEDGALSIIKCISDRSVEAGKFYGPGEGKLAFKGSVKVFDLESATDLVTVAKISTV